MMKNCPTCKSDRLVYDGLKRYHCDECGWVYFQNVAAAAAGIVLYEGKVLLVVRGKDPGAGLPDLPGGFVDPDETAEETLKREIFEELGVTITDYSYLCSFPNCYPYKGTNYEVLDLFFLCSTDRLDIKIDEREISGWKLVNLDELPHGQFAFESTNKAVQLYYDALKNQENS